MRRRNPDMAVVTQTAKDNAGLIAAAAGVGLIGLLAFRRSAQAAPSGDEYPEGLYEDTGGTESVYGSDEGQADLPPDASGGGASGGNQTPVEYEDDPNSPLEQALGTLPGDLREFARAVAGRHTRIAGINATIESVTSLATGLGQFMEGITLPPTDTVCAVVDLDDMQRPSGQSSVRALQSNLNQLFSALAEEQRRLRRELETVLAGGGPNSPAAAASTLADGRSAGQTEFGQGLRAALGLANLICGTEYFVLPLSLNPAFPRPMGNLLGYVDLVGGRRALASGIRPLASVANPRCGFPPEFLANPTVRVIPATSQSGPRVSIKVNNLPEPPGVFQLAVDGIYGDCTQRAQYLVYFLACHAGLPEVAQGFTGVDPRSGTADRSALNPSGVLTGIQSNRAFLQSLLVTLAKQWQRANIVKVSYDGPG